MFESKMLLSVARSACSWPHSDILDSVEAASAHEKRVRQPKYRHHTIPNVDAAPDSSSEPCPDCGSRPARPRPSAWHAISELGTLKPAVFPALTFSLRAAAMRLRERATAKIPDFTPFHGTSNLGNRSPIIAVGTSNLKGLCARDCQARCDKTPPNTGLTMSQQTPRVGCFHWVAGRLSIAPVAQLDRASPSEGKGHSFESSRVHHFGIRYRRQNRRLFLRCEESLFAVAFC